MMMQILADAASPDTQISGNWILAVIPVLAAAFVAMVGKNHWKAQGAKEQQMIGPQPFIVQLREEFATRRELEKVEAAMNAHVVEMKSVVTANSTEMKSLFKETMTAMGTQTSETNRLIERRHKTTMEEINSVASKAYEARGRIHTNLNATREELKELKAVSNVADQLGKLAEAITPQTKIQPTHPNR